MDWETFNGKRGSFVQRLTRLSEIVAAGQVPPGRVSEAAILLLAEAEELRVALDTTIAVYDRALRAGTIVPGAEWTGAFGADATALIARVDAWTEAVDGFLETVGLPLPPRPPPVGWEPQGPGEPDDLYEARVAAWAIAHPEDAEARKPELPANIAAISSPLAGVQSILRTLGLEDEAKRALAGAQVGLASAISTIFGSVTFAAFIMEEGAQALGLAAWVSLQAEEFDTAESALDTQAQFVGDAMLLVESWRPLMPLTYPAFARFFRAAAQNTVALQTVLAKKRAGRPLPTTGSVQVSSVPSNAEITLDGVATELLTPELLKALDPGTHTVVLFIPPIGDKPAMVGRADIEIERGKRKEIRIVLEAVRPGPGARPA